MISKPTIHVNTTKSRKEIEISNMMRYHDGYPYYVYIYLGDKYFRIMKKKNYEWETNDKGERKGSIIHFPWPAAAAAAAPPSLLQILLHVCEDGDHC